MKSLFLAAAFFAASAVFADTIKSKSIVVNPSRISDRVVLASAKGNDGILVQVIAEHTNGATDLSNTHRIILGISQIGEEREKEASFEIGRSLGLTSVVALSDGIYEIRYDDANVADKQSGLEVIKTIDAREAINLVKDGPCNEFSICKVSATISIK